MVHIVLQLISKTAGLSHPGGLSLCQGWYQIRVVIECIYKMGHDYFFKCKIYKETDKK